MRAMLWVAASGFLLASGSAYAGAGLPTTHEDAVYGDAVSEASPARDDVTTTDQDVQSSYPDVSKVQPAEAGPQGAQEKAEAQSNAVTFDPEHPGGDSWGG